LVLRDDGDNQIDPFLLNLSRVKRGMPSTVAVKAPGDHPFVDVQFINESQVQAKFNGVGTAALGYQWGNVSATLQVNVQ
jgi:hypothetical protein